MVFSCCPVFVAKQVSQEDGEVLSINTLSSPQGLLLIDVTGDSVMESNVYLMFVQMQHAVSLISSDLVKMPTTSRKANLYAAKH